MFDAELSPAVSQDLWLAGAHTAMNSVTVIQSNVSDSGQHSCPHHNQAHTTAYSVGYSRMLLSGLISGMPAKGQDSLVPGGSLASLGIH